MTTRRSPFPRGCRIPKPPGWPWAFLPRSMRCGPAMGARGLEVGMPLVREFAAGVVPLFDQRIDNAARLRAVLERTYPMAELAEAHRVMESNETFGKIVVVW